MNNSQRFTVNYASIAALHCAISDATEIEHFESLHSHNRHTIENYDYIKQHYVKCLLEVRRKAVVPNNSF